MDLQNSVGFADYWRRDTGANPWNWRGWLRSSHSDAMGSWQRTRGSNQMSNAEHGEGTFGGSAGDGCSAPGRPESDNESTDGFAKRELGDDRSAPFGGGKTVLSGADQVENLEFWRAIKRVHADIRRGLDTLETIIEEKAAKANVKFK